MWMCEQSSQRATWPPRAAVRQLSMADMTLSWPRLTWPALALRHAGPWSRKISATSSAGRDISASAGRPDLLELERDVLQRAHDLADRLGGDAGIERRGVELGVTEQHLDDADIDVLLKQMGGEAVPQGVQGDAPVDLRYLGGGVTGAIELARGHRLRRVAAREQPTLRLRRLPPGPQQVEQARREHDVTVLAAFALLHADDHPLAVDVGDLERDDFGGAQAGAVGHAQCRLVLEPRRGIEQPRHFLQTEHDRQLAGLMNECRVLDDVRAPERNPEEEPQRSHGVIENRYMRAVRRQMQLKASDVLEARRVGRSPEERSEVLDGADIALLGLRR